MKKYFVIHEDGETRGPEISLFDIDGNRVAELELARQLDVVGYRLWITAQAHILHVARELGMQDLFNKLGEKQLYASLDEVVTILKAYEFDQKAI